MISQQDVVDFLRAKRSGQLDEAERLLLKLIDAEEVEARSKRRGVAPWYYKELAILYRKQKRYDAEIEVLERYARAPKAAGVSPFKLAIRLEEALLSREEGRNGPKLRSLRAKRARASKVTIDTDLGRVTINNPYHGTMAIIASGQSAEYLRWYYDIHRQEELTRAVEDLNHYLQRQKRRSSWNDTYLKFIQNAPILLADLPQKLETALQENKAKIDRGEIRVVWGPYNTTRQVAEHVAKSLSFGALLSANEIESWFKGQVTAYEQAEKALIAGSDIGEETEDALNGLQLGPTLNAGWLNVHVVVIPEVRED
jgi:hypothetical protein